MKKAVKKQRDLQRVWPAGRCSRCGGELYPGVLCWHIDGVTLCEACFAPWMREELAAYFVPVEEVML